MNNKDYWTQILKIGFQIGNNDYMEMEVGETWKIETNSVIYKITEIKELYEDSIIIDTEDEDGVTLFFKDIIFAEERSWV